MTTQQLTFTVERQHITHTPPDTPPVADTNHYLRAHFQFDSTWDGLRRLAVFIGLGVGVGTAARAVYTVELDETDTCDIPADAIISDNRLLQVGVIGHGVDGYRLTTDTCTVTQLRSCYQTGHTPPPPTPDVYNTLLGAATAAQNSAAEAEATARQLAEDAAAGRFDGLTPHIGTDNNWYIGTTNTGISAVGTHGTDGQASAIVTTTETIDPSEPVATLAAILNAYPASEQADVLHLCQAAASTGGSILVIDAAQRLYMWNRIENPQGISVTFLTDLNGTDGQTPHIGANGNWFIGKTDTGNPAQGEDGAPGKDGADGKSAYEIYVENGGAMTEAEWLASHYAGAPEYAATTEDMTDTSKLYIGSNGNLWGYGESEQLGEQVIKENIYNPTTAKYNARLNSSGLVKDEGVAYGLLTLDYESVSLSNPCTVKVTGVDLVNNTGYNYPYLIAYYDSSKTFIAIDFTNGLNPEKDENGAYLINLKTSYANAAYIRVVLSLRASGSISAADCTNLVVSIVTEGTVVTSGWVDTGIKYANYSMTDADADLVADKMLARLDTSYVSSDKVLTVGTYTFRYDGEAVADIGVST